MSSTTTATSSISGFLEKSGRYTKSWVKRFFSFDAESCKLQYGESHTKFKASMVLKRITRCAEINPKLALGTPDLFTFTVEGTQSDGKEESYTIRCPDRESLSDWFFAMRHALGSKGAMDPFNFGLPSRDPRTDLEFVSVPVEHLYRFHLLDRAIMYLFVEVESYAPPGAPASSDSKELFVVGDRCIYLFKTTADLVRCIPITSVKKIFAGRGALGIVAAPPQHDLLLVNCTKIAEILQVLEAVLRVIPSTAGVETITAISEAHDIQTQLHLTPHEDFKQVVTAPTPKLKLKQAMEVYEKTTGQPFVFGSASKPAAPITKQEVHNAPADVDLNDPMAAALMKHGMSKYIVMLQRQHVDLELLAVMEPDDLVNFGIDNPEHRKIISAISRGEQPPGSASSAAAAPKAAAARHLISLSSDDDDDVGKKPNAAAAKAPPRPMISLSSDDDDTLLPPPKPAIRLSDSDDDAKPAQGKIATMPVPVAADDI